jgi:hypothetical protein
MKKSYSYVIIQKNYPELERETVLLENKYNPKKKYALITKIINKDGSDSITTIVYSNDLEQLQSRAKGFVSWYNYPLGIAKSIQGYLFEI